MKSPARTVYAEVSPGSGETGNRGRVVLDGSCPVTVFADIDIG